MQSLWYHYDFASAPVKLSVLAMNLGQEGGDAETRESDTQYMQTVGTYVQFTPAHGICQDLSIIRQERMYPHARFLLSWEVCGLRILSMTAGRSMWELIT